MKGEEGKSGKDESKVHFISLGLQSFLNELIYHSTSFLLQDYPSSLLLWFDLTPSLEAQMAAVGNLNFFQAGQTYSKLGPGRLDK